MILVGDVTEQLAAMPDGSVQCVITSPPYFQQRTYSGDERVIGLEATVEDYTSKMVKVFREVRRVLSDTGTLWFNCGDRYVKNKQRLLLPARLAIAFQADGWILRSEIIWVKALSLCPDYSGSCKPSSVKDRPTDAHEMLYLFSKSKSYYYDQDAIREPSVEHTRVQTDARREARLNRPVASVDGLGQSSKAGERPTHVMRTNPKGRNLRSTWAVIPQPYRGAHFASFPEALVVPCVKAGTREGDTVLDPFAGSGTVGVVALRLNRGFTGIELNPEYVELAESRIEGERVILELITRINLDGGKWSWDSETGLTQKTVRERMRELRLAAKEVSRVLDSVRTKNTGV